MVAMIKTPQSLILQFQGKTMRLAVDSIAAETALNLIRSGADDNSILETVDPLQSIRKHTSGLFNIGDDGQVFIGADRLPDVLSSRLVDFAETGLIAQAGSLVKFWENCKANSDARARTDLYAFLEHNGIPITTDGCFVAYRSVVRNSAGDLVDSYTKTFINNIGSVVTMDRAECDPNPDQTCSKGLHVATFTYAKGFSQVLLEVKVNPADVVAIPTDYNGEKMRVCKFVVMAINSETANDGKLLDRPLYDLPEDDCDDYVDDEDFDDEDFQYNDIHDGIEDDDDVIIGYAHPNGFVQKRDSNGRFLPKGR